MDKAELMQKEIEDKRKLPEELKKEIKKSIFHNLLIATIIILYLCAINILFYKIEKNFFEQQMKFFALGLISITVIMFEISYRKQSKRTCIIGIELLIFSILSLYIPYIYLYANVNLKMITTILPLSIAVYYMIKAFVIFKSREIGYKNNLSDVKEILKNDENKGYLEEESKKSYREAKANEEKFKKELLEKEQKKAKENKKKTAKNKTNNKSVEKNKKSSNNSQKTKTGSKTKNKTKK